MNTCLCPLTRDMSLLFKEEVLRKTGGEMLLSSSSKWMANNSPNSVQEARNLRELYIWWDGNFSKIKKRV